MTESYVPSPLSSLLPLQLFDLDLCLFHDFQEVCSWSYHATAYFDNEPLQGIKSLFSLRLGREDKKVKFPVLARDPR